MSGFTPEKNHTSVSIAIRLSFRQENVGDMKEFTLGRRNISVLFVKRISLKNLYALSMKGYTLVKGHLCANIVTRSLAALQAVMYMNMHTMMKDFSNVCTVKGVLVPKPNAFIIKVSILGKKLPMSKIH